MNDNNNNPLIARISDGFEAAKAGRALEICKEVSGYHDSGQLPAVSHYPFGWIIYYALHQTPDSDILSRKHLLARYLRLNVKKPHKLHSMILTEAIRLYRDARNAAFNSSGQSPRFSILEFAKLWNMANLRPGDWRRKEHEGKTMSSTAEKLITLAVDEIEQSRREPSADFIAVIDKAVAEFPDSYNLLSQRATLFILAGQREAARRLLRKALLLAPGKFYLWSRMASVVTVEENPRLRVALLWRALSAPGQEQFKGRVRLQLADTWLKLGMHGYALWELTRVRQVYEAGQWHLPAAWKADMARIPADTAMVDPAGVYARLSSLADDEIYSELPEIRVRKTYHKHPDPNNSRPGYGRPAVAWRLTDDSGRNYWIQPHRFSLHPDLPIGTQLLIRIVEGRAVKVRFLVDE
ncbi:MAG: hypothetical protein K2L83_06040 [Muribaculaceae bacterium]|nr:hypothetical protein [Muribaculaceae bacterium]